MVNFTLAWMYFSVICTVFMWLNCEMWIQSCEVVKSQTHVSWQSYWITFWGITKITHDNTVNRLQNAKNMYGTAFTSYNINIDVIMVQLGLVSNLTSPKFNTIMKQEMGRPQTPPHIEHPFQIIGPFHKFLTCFIDLTSWLIDFKISTICIWAKPNQILSTEPKSNIKQNTRSNKVKFDLGH